MNNYTVVQWVAFLYTYCFLGWCIESAIVSFTKKKIVNRGFLAGPVLPLYGFGAIVMLVSTIKVQDNLFLVYAFGVIGPTCLEYVTGALMEAIFKIKYWDYSKKKFNLNGYICLKSSLFWGGLTVVLVKGLHRYVAYEILSMDQEMLLIIIVTVTLIIVIDIVNSFKKAFDLQKWLDYETQIRKELGEITVWVSELKESFSTMDNVKQMEVVKKQEERIERLRNELEMAKTRLGAFKNSVIKSFPTATSDRFSEALEDLKQFFGKN